MRENSRDSNFDIIVIGAGHAGCEAALAAARMGKRTLVLSITLEAVAMMACNPAIGGTGKSQLVREIDALGGEMALNTDKAFIQSRMLNTAKGPAVHSLRAQTDKEKYHREMKKTLEAQENLELKQGEAAELILSEEEGKRRVLGVRLRTGTCYYAKAVVIATGTFLRGKVFIGDSSFESGPNGLAPSYSLADKLCEYGLPMRRFKTGTPARALAKSLDFSRMTEQKGDAELRAFSFMNEPEELERPQVSCWLTYTNERTHEIINANRHRSGLFTGEIVGTGPRYCPSIETKLERFPDKERHQSFIEPEGLDTEEMYIQGMSSSLPEDVQWAFYRTIPGLENAEFARPAYAIEYDCIDPTALKLSLESRDIEGFFCAGQFNGSSGYEEAAAQGLMAGINAALKLEGKEPFVLKRNEAYIGVLIDDLVNKGTDEPYRMMTSRAEYRLILRQDNADLRLSEKGRALGLVSDERYERLVKKKRAIEEEKERLESTRLSPSELNPLLLEKGLAPVEGRLSMAALLRRSGISYGLLRELDVSRPQLPADVVSEIETEYKYEAYIQKQLAQIERFKSLEERLIPEDTDFASIEGLRLEAREKLSKLRPASLGQAQRISGVSPADINVLLVYLEKRRREGL